MRVRITWYESQSFRDIAAAVRQSHEQLAEKRTELDSKETAELAPLSESHKERDAELEAWLARSEKDKKKKKKLKPAELEALQAAESKANAAWAAVLKERESARRKIQRSFKKQRMALSKAEEKQPKATEDTRRAMASCVSAPISRL